MPDLEPREDDWARGVFDRVRTAQHEPPWIPDAAAAAGVSARHRRHRTRIAGAATTAAVIGISATAYAALGGSGRDDRMVTTPASIARPSATPSATPSAASSAPAPAPSPSSAEPIKIAASDLGKYLDFTGTWTGSGSPGTPTPWSATGMTTISRLIQSMGGIEHLRPLTPMGGLTTAPEPAGESQSAIQASGYWMADADVPSLNQRSEAHPAQRIGRVTIAVVNHQFPQTAPFGPCGVSDAVFARPMAPPAGWSTCGQWTQPDGSVIITTHALGLTTGSVTVGVKKFPDGSMVAVTMTSYVVYDRAANMIPTDRLVPDGTDFVAGPAVQNGPFDDSALALFLNWTDVKGLP